MRSALAVVAILAALTGPAAAQPPTFVTLAKVDAKAGVLHETLATEAVPTSVQEQVTTQENGQTKRSTVTKTVYTWVAKRVAWTLDDFDVLDSAGKPLPRDQVWKRLKSDAVAFYSPQPTVEAKYLKLMSADAVILARKKPLPAAPAAPAAPQPVPQPSPVKD